MSNIILETYKGLVNKYQQSNRRNSERIGKSMGKINCILLTLEHTSDLDIKSDLLKDLNYVYEKLDEIEL